MIRRNRERPRAVMNWLNYLTAMTLILLLGLASTATAENAAVAPPEPIKDIAEEDGTYSGLLHGATNAEILDIESHANFANRVNPDGVDETALQSQAAILETEDGHEVDETAYPPGWTYNDGCMNTNAGAIPPNMLALNRLNPLATKASTEEANAANIVLNPSTNDVVNNKTNNNPRARNMTGGGVTEGATAHIVTGWTL